MTVPNVLQQCWAVALDLDASDIKDDDNFFDLGGDSVQAIRLAEVARERHLKLDVETVFNYPDFQDMLANSETVPITDSPSETPSKGQLNTATVRACADTCGVGSELIEDIFPTTTLQSVLLQDHIHSGAWLLQLVFELRGTQDTALVCKAFDTIHAKNQIWRTRLVQVDDEIVQVVLKDPVVWHNAIDLEEYKAKDSVAWMGFGQPLVRYAVVKEPDKTYLVWTSHHSLMDAWTRRLLFDDLESYLADPVAFTAKPDRPPFKNLVNYWRSFDTEANARLKTYYSELPRTKTLYTVPDGYTAIPKDEITRNIPIDRPTKNPITFSTMAHAAFALTLGQMTGSHETMLFSARGSRAISMPGAESIMGPMASAVMQHVSLPPEEPISTVLRSIQSTTTRMLNYEPFHTEHSFQQPGKDNHIILDWLLPGCDLLSRVAEYPIGNGKASLRVIQEQFPNPHAVSCVFKICDNGDHLKVISSFDDQLLSASQMEEMIDLFISKLKRICQGQGMSVESLMT